jgi:hypothetical protein
MIKRIYSFTEFYFYFCCVILEFKLSSCKMRFLYAGSGKWSTESNPPFEREILQVLEVVGATNFLVPLTE